jgi:hypothetical protein
MNLNWQPAAGAGSVTVNPPASPRKNVLPLSSTTVKVLAAANVSTELVPFWKPEVELTGPEK